MTKIRRNVAIVAVLLAVLLWTLLIEWEWSFVDDVGLKTAVNGYTSSEGVPGVFDLIRDLASADRTWGLFRPLYYVYGATFYLMNPAFAHGLRLAMLLVTVLVPAYRFGRGRDGFIVIAAVLAANVTMYQGLSYLSLQELAGLSFVALGLATDGPIRRSLLWLGAAWFKTPFIWLFLAWSVWLLVQRRKWALLNIVAGVATILLAAYASRRGTYTQAFSLAHVRQGLKTAIPLLGWPGVTGILGVIALRPNLRTVRWLDPLGWIFLVGGLMYFANLLPWGQAGSYYGAPPVWMLSVGVLKILLSAERLEFRLHRPVTAVALVLAVAVSARIAVKMTREQLDRNRAVVGVREWATTVPPGETIGIDNAESAHRLSELMRLHRAPRTVTYVPDTDTVLRPKYYVFFHDQSGGNPRLQTRLIHRYQMASIWATE